MEDRGPGADTETGPEPEHAIDGADEGASAEPDEPGEARPDPPTAMDGASAATPPLDGDEHASAFGFLAGWPGIAVIIGILLVLAISFLAIDHPASDGAAGKPSGTSIVIGDVKVRPVSGPIEDTERCDDKNAAATPISGSEIVIGSSFPQSSTYSSYGTISKGWKAFLETQNANGGVAGKQIKIITKDDKYDPATTKANTRELIEDDKVFALFNFVGEANNLSLRADLNKSCVPDLFAAAGAVSMGAPDRYPWVIGSTPTAGVESSVFARYLTKAKPQAKVGILRQNDEFGSSYSESFKKATSGTGITVVGEQIYDMGQGGVKSQMAKLNAAGADTLLLAVNATTCPGALSAVKTFAGWDPVTYLVAPCATKLLLAIAGPDAVGVLSATYLKDPNDPRWNDDEAMKKYKEAGAARGLSPSDLGDPAVAYGWTMGDLLVRTLQASPSLSRQDVMRTAYKLKSVTPGLLLPGISVNTNGPNDAYPIEQMGIGKWTGQYFDQQGEILSFEGKSGNL